jgi:FkbM family methyltransferase
LIKGKPSVTLATATLSAGGSWTKTAVYDPALIQFFYVQMKAIARPRIADVGAGTGSFALLPVFHTAAQVVAYEPNPEIREILEQNIRLNKLEARVRASAYAISNQTGMETLKIPEQSGMACLGRPRRFFSWDEVDVTVRRLDDVWDGRLDILKIDTEGCELMVLEGARGIIAQYHPSILTEYNRANTQQFGYQPERIKEFLREMGYKSFIRVGKEDLWIT